MQQILRNLLAVFAGLVVGSIVNMSIIMVSGSIIPPPNGTDLTTAEGLKAAMHLFEPKHFLMPFLAHALGTLVGAMVATKISYTRKLINSLIVGVFFLTGGIANIMMLPSPLWFSIVDIGLGYIPMAYLGNLLMNKITQNSDLDL